MVNEYKVGVNFDEKLLDKIIELNSKFENSKITELYGSNLETADLAARPDFRLPDIDFNNIERYVRKAKENGINFNFTLNSIMPFGSKIELFQHLDYITYLIKKLESIGVKRVTIANPLMLEIIRNYINQMWIQLIMNREDYIDGKRNPKED